jgi:A/G-specific adenine glycosylase
MGAPELQSLADAIVPPDRPADWTHALMDVGATLCRPRRPDCAGCPARAWCRFAAKIPVDADDATRRAGSVVARDAPAPFASTSRWLRGRIVERLRAASDGAWTVVEGPIGEHDGAAVSVALAALAREGLVELDRAPDGVGDAGRRARLSMS